MMSLFPKSIAFSIVPAIICMSEICGQRIVFLYVLLYMTTLILKSYSQIVIGCSIFVDFLIELHIVNAIVPLMWHQSLLYIFMFGALHFFVILSVLWLVYDETADAEKIFGSQLPFDESIRILGYCLMPYLSTIICSWYLCTVYGVEYLPYYLLVLSFAQYRMYITDPEIRNTKDSKYAAELHLLIVAIYFLTPLATFVVKHAIIGRSPVAALEMKLLMELFFIVGLCGIGISFLGLRPLLKHYVPDHSFIPLPSVLARDPAGLVRDASLVSAAMLATPAARAHGVRLHFYTGPPVALAALSAVLLSRGCGSFASRLGGLACAAVGAVAFVAQVNLFPWRVKYTLWDPTLMQRQFAGILLVTATAPLLLWLLARPEKQSGSNGLRRFFFAGVFTVFLAVFFYCEWNFYLLGHSPYHPVLLFSALIAAAIAKIPNTKLPHAAKCCLTSVLLARCFLVAAHRLSSGGGHRQVFPALDVACLWLLCLQAVCLVWRPPNKSGWFDWFYSSYGWSCWAGVAVSALLTIGLLHGLRQDLVGHVLVGAFNMQLDYAEFLVLCLLLCGAMHSQSLRAVPGLLDFPPAKLATVSAWAAALFIGLLRNDLLPFVESNIWVTLACLQALILSGIYALAWQYRRMTAAWAGGFSVAVLLTFLHSLLYCTMFKQPLASLPTVAALAGAACLSSTFALCIATRNAAVALRPALVLFACTILLSGAHLLALPTWASFCAAAFALSHQVLVCRQLRNDARSNPDVVKLTHRLSDEERAFNALLIAAYVLLLIGCWNPLDNIISLALPLMLLTWSGDKSRPVFLSCLLASCQLAALSSADFTGEDSSSWWNRLVGLCESAACLAQLPLHWILLNDQADMSATVAGEAPANQTSTFPCGVLIGCLVGRPPPPPPREASDADQMSLFIALLTMPCPVVLLLLLASSWQAACLSVATLLLGTDYLAGYRGYLGDLVRASFASLADGK